MTTKDKVAADIRGISAGTLSYLIEDTRYAAIDAARAGFLAWHATTGEEEHATWRAAWTAYATASCQPVGVAA